MRRTKTTVIATICTLTTLTMGFNAQAAQLRNDPNRPTGLISADLGVGEDQFVKCFWDVEPEVNGKPSGQKQRMNKAILLPCLQQANAGITNEKLDAVMDKYRPEGPNGRK